jgi:hypothetical protein
MIICPPLSFTLQIMQQNSLNYYNGNQTQLT